MKIYVARHTETEYNVKNILNANPSIDVRLTEKGIKQAKELAEKLKDKDFDVIYISELPRTKQTADIVNKYHQLPILIDNKINENKSGFEGRHKNEYLQALDLGGDMWRVRLNDGESLEDARNRVKVFLGELKNLSYSSILVITHGYIIESIYGIVNGLSFEESAEFQPPQGDYTLFEI
jgi:alpha-ribazole phosphatase